MFKISLLQSPILEKFIEIIPITFIYMIKYIQQ